jgi:nucleoside-diphosphate-sugar epimerase
MNISILGCGWLGLPLAQHLVGKGFAVKGSTTSADKLKQFKGTSIEPFIIRIDGDGFSENDDSFWDADILFVNIPPGRGKDDVFDRYPSQVQHIADKASEHKIGWLIFASSTSVYSSYGGLTTEEQTDPETDSGKALVEVEKNLQTNKDFDTTIIRFGGLYGYDRHPVNYLAGRKNISQGNKPVNLIHQDDCIRIIAAVIDQKVRNEVFNAVSDGHPPKREFYQTAAEHYRLPKPEFEKDSRTDYRVVSNQKLKETLNFEFSYPNPMDHTP